jgi:hypothetical protein
LEATSTSMAMLAAGRRSAIWFIGRERPVFDPRK